jgi:type IV pilus assembly protein PilM
LFVRAIPRYNYRIMANPFSFFTSLRQKISPRCLGVDIGTTSIKIVEADQGKQLPRILNYALLETKNSFSRPNVAFQTSTLKLFEEETTELLKETIKKMKPKTTRAAASLPGFSAFTTILNFPSMTESELQKTIAYQAKQYIPLPVSEVAMEPIKVGQYEDEKGFKFDQILLITVPLEQIKKYQNIFKAAGLQLAALEIEGMSLARSLVGTDPTSTVLIDIGSRSTAIAFIEKGQLRMSAQSDFAGASLTQAVSSSLNINPQRAEELKRERGIAGTGPNYELSTIMMPFVDAIINEVKRAQFNYQNQFPAAPNIERAILSGGGANLLGIERYISQQLGIPAVKASPLTRFEYNPLLEPVSHELNPYLSVALGLALREVS